MTYLVLRVLDFWSVSLITEHSQPSRQTAGLTVVNEKKLIE